MKSWKKERYRRQKLFTSIKLRRNVSKDLGTWCDELLNCFKAHTKTAIELFRKGANNESESSQS